MQGIRTNKTNRIKKRVQEIEERSEEEGKREDKKDQEKRKKREKARKRSERRGRSARRREKRRGEEREGRRAEGEGRGGSTRRRPWHLPPWPYGAPVSLFHSLFRPFSTLFPHSNTKSTEPRCAFPPLGKRGANTCTKKTGFSVNTHQQCHTKHKQLFCTSVSKTVCNFYGDFLLFYDFFCIFLIFLEFYDKVYYFFSSGVWD